MPSGAEPQRQPFLAVPALLLLLLLLTQKKFGAEVPLAFQAAPLPEELRHHRRQLEALQVGLLMGANHQIPSSSASLHWPPLCLLKWSMLRLAT